MRELALKVKHLGREGGRFKTRDIWKKLDDLSVCERAAKVAIMQTLGSQPLTALLQCAFGDEELISAGYEQIVFADGLQGVKKVLMGSNNYPVNGRDPLTVATELNSLSQACEGAAGANWMPTTFSVEKTTGALGRLRVIARQPLLIAAIPAEMTTQELINDASVPKPLKAQFGAAVLNIIEQVGVVPDLDNYSNVRFGGICGGDDVLAIVDTIPFDPGLARKKTGGHTSAYDKAMSIVEECLAT